jgi:hypothetical protein
MKSSGVLATLMLAAVAGYASAASTCGDTAGDGSNVAVSDADCKAVAAIGNIGSATASVGTGACAGDPCDMAVSADKAACCTDTPFTFDWIYDATFPGCTGTEGTDAVETPRNGQCEQTVPTGAEGTAVDASKCTGTAVLTETCPEIENTCANAGLDCTADIGGNAATLTVAKAGTTACGSTGSDPAKVPVTCTVALCCELPKCDAYTCTAGALKASPAGITGADDGTCCDGKWSELCLSSSPSGPAV